MDIYEYTAIDSAMYLSIFTTINTFGEQSIDEAFAADERIYR